MYTYHNNIYIYYMFIPYILFQLPTQWSQWNRAWEASPFWVVLPAESWGMLWRRQAWGAPQFRYVEICRNGKGVPWFPSTLPHISHHFPTKTPSNCKGSNSSVALQPSRRPIRCWSRMVPSESRCRKYLPYIYPYLPYLPVHGQYMAAGSMRQAHAKKMNPALANMFGGCAGLYLQASWPMLSAAVKVSESSLKLGSVRFLRRRILKVQGAEARKRCSHAVPMTPQSLGITWPSMIIMYYLYLFIIIWYF